MKTSLLTISEPELVQYMNSHRCKDREAILRSWLSTRPHLTECEVVGFGKCTCVFWANKHIAEGTPIYEH